jgi:hypothetical protein
MPFDKTQPTNTTKIRNLGTVIRANWDAIEIGDASFKPIALNLANRTPAVVPIDPAAIANVYQLYCKEDSHGNKQIYAEDPNARIVQITNSANPLNAANGYTWLPGGFLMQWGKAHANGNADTLIPFSTAFTAVPYSIQITQSRSTGGSAVAFYVVDDAGKAPTINDFYVYKSGGGQDFYWLAIGPKV